MRFDRLGPALAFLAAALTADGALAAGLPQLDASKFAPQIVWLVIAFAVLYAVMARVGLPRVRRALEERQKRIDEALERAVALKNEAADVAAAYEKMLAEARSAAHGVLREIADAAAAESARRHAELGVRLLADIKAAEARIRDAKERALAELGDAVRDIARAVAERLAGARVEDRTLAEAIAQVLKERR